MAGERIVRDVAGVYSRLFDHRAIVQSECKFVVRVFEGNRNDREMLKLAETAGKISEIQGQIPECIELAECLNKVQDELKDARQRCHYILEQEEQDSNKARREEIKQQSKKQWDEFLKEMDKKEEKIEKDFMTKSLKLKEKYGMVSMSETE